MIFGKNSKSRKLETHNGEGYLASSADLMIGILFIFIIMVVHLASQIKKIQVQSKEKQDPIVLITGTIEKGLKDQGIPVNSDPKSGVIALPADALFNKGQSVPKDTTAKDIIEKTKQILQQKIPCFSHNHYIDNVCKADNPQAVQLETIMVEGHTDSDQYANDPNANWHLGLDRARYIYTEFLSSIIIRDLKNEKGQPLLGLSSYADTRPSKIEIEGLDPKAKDRRVELRFILSYKKEDNELPNSSSSTDIVNDINKSINDVY